MTETPAAEGPTGGAPAPLTPAAGTPATGTPGAVARLNAEGGAGMGALAHRMGIRFLEAGPERIVATMPVEGNTQPYGLLHGGASVVLAETLGSVAAALHAGEGATVVGVDVNATHHRAVRAGLVTGVGRALHRGATLATYEVVVDDEQERRVCTARITCLIRPVRAGAPPGPGAG